MTQIKLPEYTQAEMASLLRAMSRLFDVVRLVDPTDTAVLGFTEDGRVEKQRYTCFRIWNKELRCENCTSQRALYEHCPYAKFEFMGERAYHVLSRPLCLLLDDGTALPCILEMASQAKTVELTHPDSDEDQLQKLLQNLQNKAYTDELTGAYNRRYLDEMQFAYHGQNGTAHRLAMILLDMSDFKQVNDTYGHLVGDEVLVATAAALRGCVREGDSIIRYGGDEFLVVLINCSEKEARQAIERLRTAVGTVHYGPNGEKTGRAAFGCAYTGAFRPEEAQLRALLEKADCEMYAEKRAQGIVL